jgi:hypothetical protein
VIFGVKKSFCLINFLSELLFEINLFEYVDLSLLEVLAPGNISFSNSSI